MNIFRSVFRIVKHRLYVLTGRGIRITDWVVEADQEIESFHSIDLEKELIEAMRVPDHML